MKTQHTPGPWTNDGHDGKDTQIVNSKWGAVAHVIYNGDCAQRTANAKLIAAAPALLDACLLALNGIGGDEPSQSEALAAVRSAIAKATGGTQ